MTKVYNNVSIQSFSAKKLRTITEKLVRDTKSLRIFLHKIFKIRLLNNKALLFFHLYTRDCIVHFPYSSRIASSFALLFSNLSGSYTNSVCRRSMQYAYKSFDLYDVYLQSYRANTHAYVVMQHMQNGVAAMPTRIRRFTVLRSPHTDKRSREQFEIRAHKRVYAYAYAFVPYFKHISEQDVSTSKWILTCSEPRATWL